eukprot:1166555-Pleurochrysis_carterae.AAC.5
MLCSRKWKGRRKFRVVVHTKSEIDPGILSENACEAELKTADCNRSGIPSKARSKILLKELARSKAFLLELSTVESVIEVKSTTSKSKSIFEVSMAELDMAVRAGATYVIYRIFGVGTEHVRAVQLRNPASHLRAGDGLKLYIG